MHVLPKAAMLDEILNFFFQVVALFGVVAIVPVELIVLAFILGSQWLQWTRPCQILLILYLH